MSKRKTRAAHRHFPWGRQCRGSAPNRQRHVPPARTDPYREARRMRRPERQPQSRPNTSFTHVLLRRTSPSGGEASETALGNFLNREPVDIRAAGTGSAQIDGYGVATRDDRTVPREDQRAADPDVHMRSRRARQTIRDACARAAARPAKPALRPYGVRSGVRRRRRAQRMLDARLTPGPRAAA